MESAELEVRTAADAAAAIEMLSSFVPALMLVDPSVVTERREELVRHAESIGCTVLAARPDLHGVKIPGSTMQELERYAIIETLKSVGGSTSKAAKVLGISVRKIQYRLRDWKLRPAQIVESVPTGPDVRH